MTICPCSKTKLWNGSITLLLILFFQIPSHAEERCRMDIGRQLDDSPNYDATITYRVGHSTLRLPVRYLSSDFGEIQEPDGSIRSTALPIAFWMPSLRHLEVNVDFITSFRPCENGKPPSPDEYIVEANIGWPFHEDISGYVTPEQQFENYSNFLGDTKLVFISKHNLIEYSRADGDNAFIHYRHPDGTDPQIRFRCTPPNDPHSVNPLCGGYVFFSEDKLGFYVRFPRDALPQWRAIASGVRELALRWHVRPD